MSDYMFMLENHLSTDQNRVVAEVQAAASVANFSLFLAGGAMRDMLGGFQIRDLDFVVEGNAPKLAKMLTDKAGKLSRIDPKTNKVIAEIDVPAGSASCLYGEGMIWITTPEKALLTRVDAKTNKLIESIPVGPGPRFLSYRVTPLNSKEVDDGFETVWTGSTELAAGRSGRDGFRQRRGTWGEFCLGCAGWKSGCTGNGRACGECFFQC